VAETCRQPNKIDTKTVVFCRTYPLLICTKYNGDDASKDLKTCVVLYIHYSLFTGILNVRNFVLCLLRGNFPAY